MKHGSFTGNSREGSIIKGLNEINIPIVKVFDSIDAIELNSLEDFLELIKLTNVKYIFKKESYVSKEDIIIDTQDIGGIVDIDVITKFIEDYNERACKVDYGVPIFETYYILEERSRAFSITIITNKEFFESNLYINKDEIIKELRENYEEIIGEYVREKKAREIAEIEKDIDVLRKTILEDEDFIKYKNKGMRYEYLLNIFKNDYDGVYENLLGKFFTETLHTDVMDIYYGLTLEGKNFIDLLYEQVKERHKNKVNRSI